VNSVALAPKPRSSVRWTAPTIGEVCRLINGRAYKKSELLDEGRYRVLRVGNFFTSNHWYFSDLELDDDKYCDEGDLLYAWSASFGPRIWSGNKTIYHYHIWKVEPDAAQVLRNYLFYFFDWDKELIRKEQGAGATMIHVSKGSMEARTIPLPPLDEQKRIVAVLDQAFAALDRARAQAEANLADAELLRSRGADQLLNRYAGSSPKTLLGDLAEFRNGLNFSRHSDGETVKVAGVGDFKSNFWLPVDDLKNATIEGLLSDNDRLLSGDILTVRSNGNKDLIGRVMLVGETDEVVSFSGFVIRIRLIAKNIKPEFLCHYMKSRGAVAHLLAGGGGANISNLNQGILSSLPVAVPPLEEQQNFVDSMNQLNMSINKLVEIAASKLTDLANLRQSLLQKAFSGQLT
jgi:type I restriction enzyme S subunit